MTPAQRIFKRALAEKLAFIPMGPQAAGPGGAPVDPTAAGAPPGPASAAPIPGAPSAPMDPSMGAGAAAPMDPTMAPPMDPSMGASAPPAPPTDPSAGGAPPADPSAGMPPMDPSAMGLPPLPPAPAPEEGLTKSDADVVDQVTKRTMDIVRQTLEMVGKAKPVAKADDAAAVEPTPPSPASLPGPVSGMPGFDPSTIQGPLKTASILSSILAKR